MFNKDAVFNALFVIASCLGIWLIVVLLDACSTIKDNRKQQSCLDVTSDLTANVCKESNAYAR